MKEKMIVIRDPKTFFFNFDLPKNVYLKCQTELIIKRNESLAEITIKKKIEKLLLTYKDGNTNMEIYS